MSWLGRQQLSVVRTDRKVGCLLATAIAPAGSAPGWGLMGQTNDPGGHARELVSATRTVMGHSSAQTQVIVHANSMGFEDHRHTEGRGWFAPRRSPTPMGSRDPKGPRLQHPKNISQRTWAQNSLAARRYGTVASCTDWISTFPKRHRRPMCSKPRTLPQSHLIVATGLPCGSR